MVVVFPGVFYFANATINPILYSVMSKRFRRAFRDKLCRNGLCCIWYCCRKDVVLLRSGTQNMGPFAVSTATARIRIGETQTGGGSCKINSNNHRNRELLNKTMSLREENGILRNVQRQSMGMYYKRQYKISQLCQKARQDAIRFNFIISFPANIKIQEVERKLLTHPEEEQQTNGYSLDNNKLSCSIRTSVHNKQIGPSPQLTISSPENHIGKPDPVGVGTNGIEVEETSADGYDEGHNGSPQSHTIDETKQLLKFSPMSIDQSLPNNKHSPRNYSELNSCAT